MLYLLIKNWLIQLLLTLSLLQLVVLDQCDVRDHDVDEYMDTYMVELDDDEFNQQTVFASSRGVSNSDLLDAGERLLAADRHRFKPTDFTLDVNGKDRLFTWVNETKLEEKSFALFINLLDNYNAINGQMEPPFTPQEQSETDKFLNHLLDSDVMKIVEEILVEAGKVKQGEMRGLLRDLWFDFYRRSTKLRFDDSSGFEHVFVGELKGRKVNGFHSWIQMYELEKSGHLEYLSLNRQIKPLLINVRMKWNGQLKSGASMFVGSTPEFDMAVYTLCMVARPGRRCKTRMLGKTISIQTFDVSHKHGLQVASAFPLV